MRISDWSSDVCSSDLSGLLSANVIGYSIEAVAEGASGVGGAVPFAFGAQPMKEGFIFLPIRSVQSLSHRAQLPAYEREGPEHPRHPASNAGCDYLDSGHALAFRMAMQRAFIDRKSTRLNSSH